MFKLICLAVQGSLIIAIAIPARFSEEGRQGGAPNQGKRSPVKSLRYKDLLMLQFLALKIGFCMIIYFWIAGMNNDGYVRLEKLPPVPGLGAKTWHVENWQ